MTESAQAATTTPPIDRWTPGLCWSLGFLTLISVFNYLDRSLLGLVLPLIKEDLQLSDTALGLISGLAFAVFYSLLAVPIASLADRSNRRNIVGAGFALWSLMTALTGWVANGWQLAACRFMMGAGEAAGLAPSQSMIADKFSAARRPLALSIFTTASAISGVVFMPIAGWVASTYGWRATFQVSGFVGVVLAAAFFLTVREPARVRTEADKPEAAPMWTAVATLAKIPAYLWLLAGASFMGGALYAIATWTTAMLTRVHGFSIMEVSYTVIPAGGVAGTLGILGAGLLADRLGRRDQRWRLWVPALVSILAVPGYLAFLLGEQWQVWAAGLTVVYALQAAYQGPTFAAVISMVPANMRAISIAIVVLFTGLLGQIFGPLAVGMLNDGLAPTYGDEAIRYSLLVVAACTFLGGVCFFIASLRQPRPPR
jgi:MFS family permease